MPKSFENPSIFYQCRFSLNFWEFSRTKILGRFLNVCSNNFYIDKILKDSQNFWALWESKMFKNYMKQFRKFANFIKTYLAIINFSFSWHVFVQKSFFSHTFEEYILLEYRKQLKKIFKKKRVWLLF